MSIEDFDDPEDAPSYLPEPRQATALDEFEEVQPPNYLDKYMSPVVDSLFDRLKARYDKLIESEKPISYDEFLKRYTDLQKDDERVSKDELVQQMFLHINYYFPTKDTIPIGKFRLVSQDTPRWDQMRLKWNELKPLMYDARFNPKIRKLISDIVALMIFYKGWTRGGKRKRKRRTRRFGSSKQHHKG